ncbi:molybdopterin-dependent oxidoreductase [Gordonia sp. CPCC 205515]|uniref:molybdopterin-dependent oxidoreductase n=1 Tax=Gordonia sp. CPCC 205515 TaxID=3140791 RepID=UPI003AF408D0
MYAHAERDVRAALSGIVAVGTGVAAGELVALVVSPFASPYHAVGAFLVDHAPAWAREFAIDRFGTNDKPALLIGIAVAMLVLAAVAGLVQVRRPPWGLAVIVGFVVVAITAALTRPTVRALYVAPALVSGIVAGVVLVVLCRGATPRSDESPTDTGWSRRRFLGAVGVLAVASAVGAVVVRQVGRAGGVVAERMRLALPAPRTTAAAVPDGADVTLPGATPFMTDNATFYRIDTALQVPQLSTRDWQLRVHGMVDRELTLGWDDLMAIPAVERIITLTCVSNEVGGDLASNARWLGIPMTEILSRVGVHDDADMLLSTSVDGWTSGTPISAITDGRDAMLAFGMNGTPLPLEHGYPVRQVVPGLYGFVSACKWVVDWEITRFDRAEAYWTKRGWGVQAPIKTASRIDRPAPLSQHPPGRIVVAGTAWAQHRGIRGVEVRVDDGPWEPATLATEYSKDTWRQWMWGWDATPGQHTLYCRATDDTGAVQPERRVAPIPDGATGWHSRVFRIDQ